MEEEDRRVGNTSSTSATTGGDVSTSSSGKVKEKGVSTQVLSRRERRRRQRQEEEGASASSSSHGGRLKSARSSASAMRPPLAESHEEEEEKDNEVGNSAVQRIPATSALLTPQIRLELSAIWSAFGSAADNSPHPSRREKVVVVEEEKEKEKRRNNEAESAESGVEKNNSVAAAPPPFKVGTLEMYRRFPLAYDSFMRHHDCAKVKSFLHAVLDELTSTPSPCAAGPPSLRVMDLGCGTGRIEEMLVQHPAVDAVFAYDKERNMLTQCLLNTAKAAKAFTGVGMGIGGRPSAFSSPRKGDGGGGGSSKEEEAKQQQPAAAEWAPIQHQRQEEQEGEEGAQCPPPAPYLYYRAGLRVIPFATNAMVLEHEDEDEDVFIIKKQRSPKSASKTREEEVQERRAAEKTTSHSSGDADADEDDAPQRSHLLTLCVRPVSFEDINRGFLTHTIACEGGEKRASFSSSSSSSSLFARSHPRCHLIVCAWSFSYVMRQQWGSDNWHATTDRILHLLWDHLEGSSALTARTCDNNNNNNNNPPCPSRRRAAMVIIETLGHGVETPSRQSTFPQRLEEVWGFERYWVRTDYHFESCEEAVAHTQFFFGKSVAAAMERDRATTLPECTGLWVRWKTD